MRESGNIQDLLMLEPDYIGFIFFAKSKRYAGNLEKAALASISTSIKKTGVFVNEELKEVTEIVSHFNLDAVQLHGSESKDFCGSLKRENVELIKAFGVDEDFDFKVLEDYEDVVDYFLFDTKTSGHGGSGKAFNWSVLDRYKLNKPYFLSGGLSLENLEHVKDLEDKRLYAVDINSKFETEPGLKDIEKLKQAFEIIRN